MTQTATPQRPTNVRWGVFGLMVTTSWLLYLHRYVFSFLKPRLKDEWGLTNTELGEIDSGFAIAYGVLQFPVAVLADVFGVHLMLACLLTVWLAGLGIISRATTANGLWYGNILLGAGQSAVYACLNRVARMWYPPSIRATMQGVAGIFAGRMGNVSTSILFAMFMLGMLHMAWPTAVGWLVAAGVLQLVLFVVIFRNSPQVHPWVNAAEAQLIAGTATSAPPAMSLRRMLSSASPRSLRNLACVTLQSLLSTIADVFFSNWVPTVLTDVNPDLDYTAMGFYASLPLLGGAFAGMVGGLLNDYLIAKTGNRRWSPIGIAVIGKGLAAALLMVALQFYRQPYLFCVVLFFVKFFGDWSLVALWSVIPSIGGRATASVFALINSIATIGQYVAPQLYGYISDEYGWPAVFVTVSATLALTALSWFAIDGTIPVMEEPQEEPRTQ